MRRRLHEFIAFLGVRQGKKKGQRNLLPALPYIHSCRRSGRSPALPYPPHEYGNSNTVMQFFFSFRWSVFRCENYSTQPLGGRFSNVKVVGFSFDKNIQSAIKQRVRCLITYARISSFQSRGSTLCACIYPHLLLRSLPIALGSGFPQYCRVRRLRACPHGCHFADLIVPPAFVGV